MSVETINFQDEKGLEKINLNFGYLQEELKKVAGLPNDIKTDWISYPLNNLAASNVSWSSISQIKVNHTLGLIHLVAYPLSNQSGTTNFTNTIYLFTAPDEIPRPSVTNSIWAKTDLIINGITMNGTLRFEPDGKVYSAHPVNAAATYFAVDTIIEIARYTQS